MLLQLLHDLFVTGCGAHGRRKGLVVLEETARAEEGKGILANFHQ